MQINLIFIPTRSQDFPPWSMQWLENMPSTVLLKGDGGERTLACGQIGHHLNFRKEGCMHEVGMRKSSLDKPQLDFPGHCDIWFEGFLWWEKRVPMLLALSQAKSKTERRESLPPSGYFLHMFQEATPWDFSVSYFCRWCAHVAHSPFPSTEDVVTLPA